MSMMTTTAYNDLVNLIQLELQKVNSSLKLEARDSGLFIEKAKANGTGDTMRFEYIDGEEYASNKPEGQASSDYATQMGYSIDVTLKRISKNVVVTYEMWKYNKYDVISYSVSKAVKSLSKRLDLDLQHRISFATATSYVDKDGDTISLTVGDGLALVSTAHTLRASASTFRNRLANNPQVSKGALELMEKMWRENKMNEFGEKIGGDADTIYFADDSNTENTIMELLQSTAAVSAPNAGVVNVYKGKYRPVKLSKIATTAAGIVDTTKSKYWGLVQTGEDGWQAYFAVNEEAHIMPLDQSNHYDVNTDIYTFPARMGYGIGILSGRGFTLSTGDGAA